MKTALFQGRKILMAETPADVDELLYGVPVPVDITSISSHRCSVDSLNHSRQGARCSA